jgi:hypothetical protein
MAKAHRHSIVLIMGPLSGLLTFFGCDTKAKQNLKTINTDTTIVKIYPTDHKLTSQERKDLTNTFLKQKGVPASFIIFSSGRLNATQQKCITSVSARSSASVPANGISEYQRCSKVLMLYAIKKVRWILYLEKLK